MGARQSNLTKEALQLVRDGKTGAEAAKIVGLHASTLYRNKEYCLLVGKQIKQEKPQAKKSLQQPGIWTKATTAHHPKEEGLYLVKSGKAYATLTLQEIRGTGMQIDMWMLIPDAGGLAQ